MKKKYIQPEILTYQVNTSEVICASAGEASYTVSSSVEPCETDEEGNISCCAASYRSSLWN